MDRSPGCGADGAGCNGVYYMVPPPPPAVRSVVNAKVMVVAVGVLFAVVMFILCLHIYAKWFWRTHAVSVVTSNGTMRTVRTVRSGDARVQAQGEGGAGVAQSVGLDRAVVEALPSFVYSSAERGDQDRVECAVCLEEFEDGERGRTLPKCGHGFHLECIDMWLHSHSTCPLCRTGVGEEEGEVAKGSSEAVTVVVESHAAEEEVGPAERPVVGDVGAPFMAAMRQHRRSRARVISGVTSLPRSTQGDDHREEEADREVAAGELQQSLKDYETPESAATSSVRAPFQVTIDIPRAGGAANLVSNTGTVLSPMARASASFRRLLSRGKSVVTPQSPAAADEGGPSSSPRPPPSV